MGRRPAEQRRRADAERNVAAILDAAVAVLSERPDANMDAVARAAGVSRQTVYAHFASRDALLTAVGERTLARALAAFEDAKLDEGDPAAALDRLIAACWETATRDRLFELPALPVEDEHEAHGPILQPLELLVRRGQRSGAFDREAPPGWLAAAFVALFHAAAAEVAGGRLAADDAFPVLRRSVLRAFGVAG